MNTRRASALMRVPVIEMLGFQAHLEQEMRETLKFLLEVLSCARTRRRVRMACSLRFATEDLVDKVSSAALDQRSLNGSAFRRVAIDPLGNLRLTLKLGLTPGFVGLTLIGECLQLCEVEGRSSAGTLELGLQCRARLTLDDVGRFSGGLVVANLAQRLLHAAKVRVDRIDLRRDVLPTVRQPNCFGAALLAWYFLQYLHGRLGVARGVTEGGVGSTAGGGLWPRRRADGRRAGRAGGDHCIDRCGYGGHDFYFGDALVSVVVEQVRTANGMDMSRWPR